MQFPDHAPKKHWGVKKNIVNMKTEYFDGLLDEVVGKVRRTWIERPTKMYIKSWVTLIDLPR